MSSEFELVELKGGGQSLRPLGGGEIFHPVIGPMAEASILHVEQQRLALRCRQHAPFIVWDVGLGAAANAIAALAALKDSPNRVELHSFDLHAHALQFAIAQADKLVYPHHALDTLMKLEKVGCAELGAVFWQAHYGDFYEKMRSLSAPHAVFYDPYSPQANPGMWTLERFLELRARLTQPCLLSNYTRSTAVRVTLLLAGFYVGFGAAVGEKEQTTVFSNDLALLAEPLPKEWLGRVRNSTKGAPLREAQSAGPISPEDWQALATHPQFQ